MSFRGAPMSSTWTRPVNPPRRGRGSPASRPRRYTFRRPGWCAAAAWPVSQSSPLGKSIANLGAGRRVDLVDDRIQRRPRLAAGPGAQQGIDDPRGPGQVLRQPLRIVPVAENLDRHAGLRMIWKLTPASPCSSSGSAHSNTRTAWPRRSRCRASTKPSPALFPLPQQMTICSAALVASALEAMSWQSTSAAPRPAFSISTSPGHAIFLAGLGDPPCGIVRG